MQSQDFTTAQRRFLDSHSIKPTEVFDAKGLPPRMWKAAIAGKKSIQLVANTSPCKKANHTIKTRSGHCPQCKPAAIGYQRNHRGSGYLYIARSDSAKYLKIGLSSNLKQRESALNSSCYGGYRSWRILWSQRVTDRIGDIESALHSKLAPRSVAGLSYIKDGKQQKATELFDISLDSAIAAAEHILATGIPDSPKVVIAKEEPPKLKKHSKQITSTTRKTKSTNSHVRSKPKETRRSRAKSSRPSSNQNTGRIKNGKPVYRITPNSNSTNTKPPSSEDREASTSFWRELKFRLIWFIVIGILAASTRSLISYSDREDRTERSERSNRALQEYLQDIEKRKRNSPDRELFERSHTLTKELGAYRVYLPSLDKHQ